jgi:hypothetical protein
VVCPIIPSEPVYETLPACNCQSPTGFNVLYTEDCKKAQLTWDFLGNEKRFNLYRDNAVIASNLNANSYIDETFNPLTAHTWKLIVVCEGGAESDAVEKPLDACITPCYPAKNLNIEFPQPNCSEAVLTWTAPAPEQRYNIYRNEALLKTNHEETTYTDTSIEEGTDYTWSVTVLCEPDLESDPVSDTKKCLGINENIKPAFTIVPNPAIKNITVTAGTNFHTVEVINFLGQIVISQANIGNSAQLDVATLSKGVYFVRIISDNGANVQKFVKQ